MMFDIGQFKFILIQVSVTESLMFYISVGY